jgi:hypothetical protein
VEGTVLLAHLPVVPVVPAGEEEGEGHWVPAGRGEVAADSRGRAEERAHLTDLQVACSQLQPAVLALDDLIKTLSKSQYAKNSKEVSTIMIMMCQEREINMSITA